MIDVLKRIFDTADGESRPAQNDDEKLTVAVTALLLEMGKIDHSFTSDEMDHVVSTITKKFGLSRENADAIMEEAERELRDSVDLWQFARTINEHYSNDEKIRLIERLWEVVYVDGEMNRHEHYLMNKVSKLLRISHKNLIAAKLTVLHG
jgi:uncharacterized tellurite resistance protein B-like protein